jgi:hypothetical protein
MMEQKRAHHTIDVPVRKRDAIGQRLVKLEADALGPSLRLGPGEYLAIAVDADQGCRFAGTADGQRHLPGATAEIQDPHRGTEADRSLDQAWTPASLAHRHRVHRVVERRQPSTAGCRDIAITHSTTITPISALLRALIGSRRRQGQPGKRRKVRCG